MRWLLKSIQLDLIGASLLICWQSDVEIASSNAVATAADFEDHTLGNNGHDAPARSVSPVPPIAVRSVLMAFTCPMTSQCLPFELPEHVVNSKLSML
jgi:hypothetical protein